MTPIKFDLKNNKEPMVIAGLGNIGKEYEKTRHNAGFLFVDRLKEVLEDEGYLSHFKQEQLYDLTVFPRIKLALIKPKTLMNLSGKALHEYYRFHNEFRSRHLVVVHDDLDLMLGDFKINIGKGPRLHNGLRSIDQELTSSDYIRIRLGIENRNGLPITGLDYVLYKFQPEELVKLKYCLDTIISERFIY